MVTGRLAASQVVAVTLRGGGVRCGAYVPGQFDFAMGAYLDRLILALSFAVGRWHFWVVRHATRCARLWLAWAVVGGGQLRLGVCVCGNGSLVSNQKEDGFLESEESSRVWDGRACSNQEGLWC